MTSEPDLLRKLSGINQSAAFNRWAGFEVCRAVVGGADVRLERRPEHGQYSDFLHVGLVAALIATCCGFAAATLFDHVLATHFSIDCLSPALGQSFLAKGRVVKSDRKQIFTNAELHAFDGGKSKLVATGTALLVRLGEPSSGIRHTFHTEAR
jgi:acyl-coenzyme A thioesterase PaaI-like protein